MKTPLLIEQHFHGAFGIDFNKANPDEIVFVAQKLKTIGIGGFFPTLVTDSVDNLKRQIEVIKKASKITSGILGIHLEGNFINPLKKGIHNENHFLDLTKENFQKIEDDFIKIVTLAPELDNGLVDYLRTKKVKIQAGHCIGGNLDNIDGVTHMYNAMQGISHRGASTALSALLKDDVYAEIIGDGVHVSDDAIKLLFKSKPKDKIILISDALPITYSDKKESIFADSKIYYDGIVATSQDGTIAGSTKLLPEIIAILASKNLFDEQYIYNIYRYHNLPFIGEIEWDNCWRIVNVVQY